MSTTTGARSRSDSYMAMVKRLSMVQIGFVAVLAIVAMMQKGSGFAIALIYGGLISLAGTWVHAWRVHIATEAAKDGLGIDATELVKGSVFKFFIVIALFALGLSVIRLEPLAIVLGFVIAQLSYMFTRGYAARRKPARHG